MDKHPEIRTNAPISKEKKRYSAAQYYRTSIEIKHNGMLSLGDFTMNLAENKILTANIEVKYKHKHTGWFSEKRDRQEIMSKSGVLRDAVIDAMYGTADLTNNDKVKDRIRNSLNRYLQNGKVQEVYFNKFIIQ